MRNCSLPCLFSRWFGWLDSFARKEGGGGDEGEDEDEMLEGGYFSTTVCIWLRIAIAMIITSERERE